MDGDRPVVNGDSARQEEHTECWYEGEIPEGWKSLPMQSLVTFLDHILGNINVYKAPGRRGVLSRFKPR